MDVLLDELQEIGAKAELYSTGFGRLISYEGNLIIHPDENSIGKPAGAPGMTRAP